MEQHFLHLVWCDLDDAEPVFLRAFNTRMEAAEYMKLLKEKPHIVFQEGLHPANLRISIVSYGKK